MIRVLKYSEIKVLADEVQKCMDEGGMNLWCALVDSMDEVLDGISLEPDCRFTKCDYGMALAGKGSCPVGNPSDWECSEFSTKWSG